MKFRTMFIVRDWLYSWSAFNALAFYSTYHRPHDWEDARFEDYALYHQDVLNQTWSHGESHPYFKETY